MTDNEFSNSQFSSGQFSSRDDGDVCVVTVTGEIDLSNVAGLRRAVEEATAGRSVVVDLRAVTYIDSAGIYAIDRAAAWLAERDRRMRVVAPPESHAGWAFKVAGFTGDLVSPSLQEALRGVGTG
jgi:anti-anti-sigma factor